MKNILIIAGADFIGLNLSKKLLEKVYKIFDLAMKNKKYLNIKFYSLNVGLLKTINWYLK
mgnify:CR=1 FL=1|tara:strand:- start:333 stop:512 length:180 start_codon:yes stop_codon:yes gene_type:complete